MYELGPTIMLCEICGSLKEKLHLHVEKEHNISFENYLRQFNGITLCLNCSKPTMYASRLRKFREFCSRSCTTSYRHHFPEQNLERKEEKRLQEGKESQFTCPLCSRNFKEKFFSHLWKQHLMTREDYSLQYLGIQPLSCKECGRVTEWSRKYKKYKEFCGHSCRASYFNKRQVWRQSVLIQGIYEKCQQDEVFARTFYRNFKSYTCKYLYKDIYFRSKFEREIAKYLDVLDLVWSYEEIIFFNEDGSSIVTIPDFYIADSDLFIEAKSKDESLTQRVYDKLECVKNQNCSIHLLIEKPHWKKTIDTLVEKRVL